MIITVRKGKILLSPETEAEKYQLGSVAIALEDQNIQADIQRQWEVRSISIPLIPK